MRAAQRRALIFGFALLALQSSPVSAALGRSFNGFNIIMVPGHAFGSNSARRSLANIKRVGANAVAIIPFLWQPDASSGHIQRGGDMSDDELRAAISDAHALGLIVVVKPQVSFREAGPARRSPARSRTGIRGLSTTALRSSALLVSRPRATPTSLRSELS